jgi:hypothetical protein
MLIFSALIMYELYILVCCLLSGLVSAQLVYGGSWLGWVGLARGAA